MDALPLVIDQRQLQLMQNSIDQAISQLQNEHQSGQFSSQDKQEQNLLRYGTNDYEAAHSLVQTVEDQIKSNLENWNGDSNRSTPVSLNLNSYQIQLLRDSVRRQSKSSSQETIQLAEDLLKQLPESSPQEDAD